MCVAPPKNFASNTIDHDAPPPRARRRGRGLPSCERPCGCVRGLPGCCRGGGVVGADVDHQGVLGARQGRCLRRECGRGRKGVRLRDVSAAQRRFSAGALAHVACRVSIARGAAAPLPRGALPACVSAAFLAGASMGRPTAPIASRCNVDVSASMPDGRATRRRPGETPAPEAAWVRDLTALGFPRGRWAPADAGACLCQRRRRPGRKSGRWRGRGQPDNCGTSDRSVAR